MGLGSKSVNDVQKRFDTDTLTSISHRNNPALPNINMHVVTVQIPMCLAGPPALPKIQHADHAAELAIGIPDVKAPLLHRRSIPMKSHLNMDPKVANPRRLTQST